MAAVPTTPTRQFKPGDRLAGKYSLTRRIAVGGMGEIWVARNEMTAAEVAVKVLRADIERKADVEGRFRHEAQVGATLSHRNVVKVFDLAAEPDGTLVLVMELLRGETLRRALKVRTSPMSATEATAIIVPVLSALQHAHDVGIVHRDLKPANILLAVDPDGHVTPKLLDFGIAKVANSSVKTLFGRVLGTPRYMSPEQIRGEQKLDGRSDVFSVGVLLIELMTGSSPFRAVSPSASLAAVLEQEIDPDQRVDPQVWLVLKRAIAKRAYERFASASEFATALKRAVGATDAELQEALQRAAPARASFSDLASVFGPDTGDSDNDDADAEEVDLNVATTAGPDDGVEPGIGVTQPSRTRLRWIAAVVLGAAALLLTGAFLVQRTRPLSQPVATGGQTTVPSTAPSPAEGAAAEAPSSNSSGSAATSEGSAPKEPPAKSSASVSTAKPSKGPPKKKPVARTPDF